MDKDVTANMDVAALQDEVMRLRTAIRQHKDEKGHQRCKLDDARLYAVLPEGDQGWESELPPLCEWMTECRRHWHQRQDNPPSDPEYQGIVVAGTPGGDGECWHFVVSEDEYRRVVGEEMYEIEMNCRKEIDEGPLPFLGKDFFTLDPGCLLRAVGCEPNRLISLWLQFRYLPEVSSVPEDAG